MAVDNICAGSLVVMHTHDTHEVVLHLPELKPPDEHGVGHIVLSPEQARSLANSLVNHATYAETEAKTAHSS